MQGDELRSQNAVINHRKYRNYITFIYCPEKKKIKSIQIVRIAGSS